MMQGPLRLAAQYRDYILRRPRPRHGPFRLWVDITSRCNLKCPACPQRLLGNQDRRDMPDALLESLAAQVADGAAREVNLFHRGEPLLHPRIGFWARRFREAGALVRLHSNATLLNRERVEEVLEAAPHYFTASVDTLDPAAYAASRPGADLERTLGGLELLLAGRRRRGLSLPRVTLLLMGPPGEKREAGAGLKRLKMGGLDRVVRRAPHNWAGAVGAAAGGGLHACTFPWYGLAVLSTGVATPCPQDFFGKISLGDAIEEPLMAIWQSRGLRRLRQAHARSVLGDYPICLACDRVRRPFSLGLPLEHLHNFLLESIFGRAGQVSAKPWKK